MSAPDLAIALSPSCRRFSASASGKIGGSAAGPVDDDAAAAAAPSAFVSLLTSGAATGGGAIAAAPKSTPELAVGIGGGATTAPPWAPPAAAALAASILCFLLSWARRRPPTVCLSTSSPIVMRTRLQNSLSVKFFWRRSCSSVRIRSILSGGVHCSISDTRSSIDTYCPGSFPAATPLPA